MQFDLRTMAGHMGGVAWAVVAVLTIMSIYSIGVMIERYYTYSQATKQSRKYAPEVARFLKQGKIKEAIDASHGPTVKHSHLAKVLVVGLQEWQYQQEIGEAARDRDAAVDAAKRAIQRATAVNLADLKRGLSGLATIGSTAPFVGLFGTTFGIINAFSGMALTGSGGIAAISAGIAEALITTAFGLFVALPRAWAYNFFAGKVEGFNVEMDNSSSELLDYFIKKGAWRPATVHPGTRLRPRPSIEEFPHVNGSRRQEGRGDRGHQRHAHGRHHDRPPHHLHGDHSHAPEGRGREAAVGRQHQGAQGRGEDDHGGDQEGSHDLPGRGQARQA